MPLQSLLIGTAAIVARPACRLLNHDFFHGRHQSGSWRLPCKHISDCIETVEGFAQRERQPWSDLEDCKAAVNESRQGFGLGW